MLKTASQGLAVAGDQLGQGLHRVERWLGRSWASMALFIAILAALAGISGMMAGTEPDAESLSFLLISALLVVPLIGMLAAFRARQAQTAFALGLTTAVVELLLAVQLLMRFQPQTSGMQFVERFDILGFNIHLGVDGISILFLPLTALLTLFVLLYTQSHRQQQAQPGVFVANILALEFALIGMFTAINLLQFWMFTVAEVIPAAFFNRPLWHQSGAKSGGRHFLRFMGSGLAALLAGIGLLGWNHAAVTDGGWSFTLSALLETPRQRVSSR